ncbi:putative lipoprotein, partial [Mycobacterium xenopi 4042]
AKAEYTAAMSEMADKVAALVPGMKWTVDENSWDHCAGEYVWTRAVRVFERIVFDRPIPTTSGRRRCRSSRTAPRGSVPLLSMFS